MSRQTQKRYSLSHSHIHSHIHSLSFFSFFLSCFVSFFLSTSLPSSPFHPFSFSLSLFPSFTFFYSLLFSLTLFVSYFITLSYPFISLLLTFQFCLSLTLNYLNSLFLTHYLSLYTYSFSLLLICPPPLSLSQLNSTRTKTLIPRERSKSRIHPKISFEKTIFFLVRSSHFGFFLLLGPLLWKQVTTNSIMLVWQSYRCCNLLTGRHRKDTFCSDKKNQEPTL